MIETAAAEQGMTRAPAFDVTDVSQIVRLGSRNSSVSHAIRLEGTEWWVKPAEGRYVLIDQSGAAELEMNLAGPLKRGHPTLASSGGLV